NFSIYDMSLSVDSPLKSAAKAEKPEKDLPLAELEERIVELQGDRYAQAPYKVEWHKRFAFPLAALVFALVAFPLAVRSHRGGRDSTHILDRYLLRELLAFMGVGLAVAGTLFVVVDLLQTLDRFIRNKPPLMFVLEHFVYRLPAALQQGLPVVMLVATIFLFLALTRAHELTAMKAAGM